MSMQHLFWSKKTFWFKRILVPKKKFGSKNIFGPKIFFGLKKSLVQHEFFITDFLVQKKICPKILLVNFFFVKQMLCQKFFWVGRGINFLNLDTPTYQISGPTRSRAIRKISAWWLWWWLVLNLDFSGQLKT